MDPVTPEKNWALISPWPKPIDANVEANTARVLNALASVGLESNRPLIPLRVGWLTGRNVIYGIPSHGLVARVSTDEISQAGVRRNHTISSLLAETATIMPIHADPIECDGQLISLIPAGTPLFTGDVRPSEVGTALRLLHGTASSNPGLADKLPAADPLRRLRRVAEAIDASPSHHELKHAFSSSVKRASEEVTDLFKDDAWWGFAHSDVWPGNFLTWRGNMRWIDLDNSGMGCVLGDFAQFQYAVPAFGWSQAWLDAFFAGYGRKPTELQLKSLERFNALVWIGFDTDQALRLHDPKEIKASFDMLRQWNDHPEQPTPRRTVPWEDPEWHPPRPLRKF